MCFGNLVLNIIWRTQMIMCDIKIYYQYCIIPLLNYHLKEPGIDLLIWYMGFLCNIFLKNYQGIVYEILSNVNNLYNVV